MNHAENELFVLIRLETPHSPAEQLPLPILRLRERLSVFMHAVNQSPLTIAFDNRL